VATEEGYGPIFSFTLRALKSAEALEAEADPTAVTTDQSNMV